MKTDTKYNKIEFQQTECLSNSSNFNHAEFLQGKITRLHPEKCTYYGSIVELKHVPNGINFHDLFPCTRRLSHSLLFGIRYDSSSNPLSPVSLPSTGRGRSSCWPSSGDPTEPAGGGPPTAPNPAGPIKSLISLRLPRWEPALGAVLELYSEAGKIEKDYRVKWWPEYQFHISVQVTDIEK